MATPVWTDKKRTFLGLPWSFTRYTLTEEKLLVETGFFNKKEEEVRLYRIIDVTLNRSFGERMLKLGTIHCCTSDKTTPEFDIALIKKPREVKDLLSDLVEKERAEHKVGMFEHLDRPGAHAGDDCIADKKCNND